MIAEIHQFFFFTEGFSHFLNTKCGKKNQKNCDQKVTKSFSKKKKKQFFLSDPKTVFFENWGGGGGKKNSLKSYAYILSWKKGIKNYFSRKP